MSSLSDTWLIRTADNVVAGPYTRSQVCDFVREGRLTHQDEVCAANGYWIYLQERDEVKSQLGIDMPKPARGDDDEVTQTDARAETTGDVIPDLPDLGESSDMEQTSMLSNAALRTFQHRKKDAPAKKAQAEVRSDAVEAEKTREEPRGGNGSGAEAATEKKKPEAKAGRPAVRVRLKRQWERFDKATGGNGMVTAGIAAVAVALFVVLRLMK